MKKEKNLVQFLLTQTRSYTKEIFFVILSLAILSFLQFLNPQITRNILDVAIANQNKQLLIQYILMILGLSIALGIINYIVSILMTHISQSILSTLRTNLFKHILKQDFSFFENSKTGDLMTRLNSDIRTIQGLISVNSLSMISNILQFFMILTFMFIFDLKLTLYILITFPFLYTLNKSFSQKMRKSHQSLRKNASKISNHLQSSISSMLLIKNFNAEKITYSEYEALNEHHLIETKNANKLNASFTPLIQLMNTLATLIVWVYGGFKVIDQTLSVGDLLAYLSYLGMLQSPIRSFSSMVHRYQEATVSYQRIEELLQTEPTIVNVPYAKPFEHEDVTVKDLNFAYQDGTEVLKDLNMILKKGQTSAIVGKSGSGKTTFAKLLSRLYDTTIGNIYYGDTNIKDIDLNELKNNISIVSQDVIILDGTIRDNILFGHADVSEKKLIEASKNANIYDFIQSLEHGFDTQVGERGIKLSGGQKQRISIARIFIKDSPILILDEATASLDNESERTIQNALNNLMKNRTTLVIAHRLSTIQNADNIMVMENGSIIEEGKHQELLSQKGAYHTLYTAQFN